MAWTDPLLSEFETGDILTQGNLQTYLLDNLLALPHKLDFTVSDLDVANTVAETTLYTVTVPANTLGTTGLLGLWIEGDYLWNNNTVNTITVRIKFGGVTVLQVAYTPTVATSGLSASRFPFFFDIRMANRSATDAQLMTFRSQRVWNYPIPFTVGIGMVDHLSLSGQNTATIDTTVDQALLVSIQWSAASANNSFRRRTARTEIGRN